MTIIEFAYIAASVLFVIGLKWMSHVERARRGNMISSIGMLLAIVATLLYNGMSYQWIIVGIALGSVIGAWSALKVPMTSMPEFVGLYNGFGGLASLLVGTAEFVLVQPRWAAGASVDGPAPMWFTSFAVFLTVLIGGVTFSGSMVAYCKLAERIIPGKPVLYAGQHIINAAILILLALIGVLFALLPTAGFMLPVLLLCVALALLLGVLVTIPIGGADMPVVICLLNSYSGLAGAAAGFVILNPVLIVAGSLVGASGIILSIIMCKAMNRSFANVFFGGFGATAGAQASGARGEAKSLTPEDAYLVLEAANSVVFIPGYGMAVAQAQHVVRELGDLIETQGAEVKYAIHPVAGRMPGHMNVLLAEADVPYEQLVEMDDINPLMESVDVAIVIGANDVVNPAARSDESSPIYGMPIIDADKARTVFVLKRSMASGFAGIENPLFYNDNTRMIFGDAKKTLQAIVSEFKES
ncbi:MAG: NAD(P)(+) transhydrogenase (Re/Si-specific) subunit beta [Candidatus Hydrogenedentes bacterium]|nr:NAD(P)(+) transhydrogenase (Re/Si-specific) subunit beta [Candidatus Hydrogenedentota bacterium]